MFLLVSGHHVGAHTDGHQHGVSIQISINLGKKFLRISRIRKIAVTRILARVFAYLPSFISQILDFIYWRFSFLFWSILNCVTLKTSNWCYSHVYVQHQQSGSCVTQCMFWLFKNGLFLESISNVLFFISKWRLKIFELSRQIYENGMLKITRYTG